MTRTELAVQVVRGAHTVESDTQIIKNIVWAINANFDSDGVVDSHQVANAVFARRSEAWTVGDWDQCKDYVQHLFREAAHVCRHADGHDYRIHKADKCSADCDAKYARSTTARRPASKCCFVETTTQGTCPFGCDD